MMSNTPNLFASLSLFETSKNSILEGWLSFEASKVILENHGIQGQYFSDYFASGVFDYFMEVITGDKKIGDCPVMADLLVYLKDRDVSSDELFILCSHFRKAMIDFSYDCALNSKEVFDEISYVFDLNFSGVLKRYSETIYQKELEIERNVKLLNEYKKAMDASAIVSKMDLQGHITFVNDNFCAVSGYQRKELLHKSHGMVFKEENNQPFTPEFLKTIKSGKIYNKTLKKQKKDGEFVYVDSTIVPIVDTEGEVSEYIVIGYEVTTLIKAEQEAIEAGISKEYFLSNMSHEIRTPLNAILGFVSILQDEIQTPTHKKYLEIVLNSGENLLTIINDILDFSKLRSGEFTIENSRFNLHEELTHTLELFVASANEKEITMLAYLDPNIPYELEADPLRIKQIVANFISNAIKFTPTEGVVELEAFCDDEMLRISIKDTGIGLCDEDKERIFNAFTQAKNSESVSGGSGLGLAICKKLAEHMHGDVYVTSTLGEGSTFTLEIPVRAHKKKTFEMYNVAPFQKLTLALLCQEGNLSKTLTSLKRYLDSFEMDVVLVDALQENSYDMLFFSDIDVSELLREKIAKQMLPSVAIMDYFDNRYEDISNITPLYFPIYCSKLYHTFLEALQLSQDEEPVQILNTPQKRHFKGNILVAEDNLANQELMKIILDGYGLHYLIAADGQEAVMRFKSGHFDLVFMDEQMPRKSGSQATKEIRRFEESHERSSTPIVALTANVLKGEREKSADKGFDAFLGKPIVIREMESVLEQFLSEGEGMSVPHLTEKPVVLEKFDLNALAETLMLETSQVIHLMEVYRKNMSENLSKLHLAIIERDYKKIEHIAHSIKGSSANFRIDYIVEMASVMEEAAHRRDEEFIFLEAFEKMESSFHHLEVL